MLHNQVRIPTLLQEQFSSKTLWVNCHAHALEKDKSSERKTSTYSSICCNEQGTKKNKKKNKLKNVSKVLHKQRRERMCEHDTVLYLMKGKGKGSFKGLF
jgi:hypothetical protein